MGVKVGQRKLLHHPEQVFPDVVNNFLGGPYHSLRVAVGGQNACQVDSRCQQDAENQSLHIPRHNVPVNQRLKHVGSQQICPGAYGHKDGYQKQKELMTAHVGEKAFKGLSQIFGFFPLICAIFHSSFHLGSVDFLINGIGCQKRLMIPHCVDPSVLQNDDLICVHYGGDPLGDDQLGGFRKRGESMADF